MAELCERMKEYEKASSTTLMKRTPVIIRVDGRSFSKFTRGFYKPFDDIISTAMENTARALVNELQGARFAYTQSDEISVLLTDWDTFETCAMFGNRKSKLESISASIATYWFNKTLLAQIKTIERIYPEISWNLEKQKYCETLKHKSEVPAYFDGRAFNVPREDVTNYFVWRQKDAIRNSVEATAHANFSQQSIQSLNNSQLQEKLFQEKGINWDKFPDKYKRGLCVVYDEISTKTPEFTKDRNFVERFLIDKERGD